jgi:hypothetical protein
MKPLFAALCIVCSACAATPPARELPLTVTGKGNECLLTFGGQQFVTQRLESPELLQRLDHIRGEKVVLWFVNDAPYRCVGATIITLQQAKVRFRVPQIPPR